MARKKQKKPTYRAYRKTPVTTEEAGVARAVRARRKNLARARNESVRPGMRGDALLVLAARIAVALEAMMPDRQMDAMLARVPELVALARKYAREEARRPYKERVEEVRERVARRQHEATLKSKPCSCPACKHARSLGGRA